MTLKVGSTLERRSTDNLMNLFGKGVELKDIDMKYVMTVAYITCQTTLLSSSNEGFDDSKMLTTILAIVHAYGLVQNQLTTSSAYVDKKHVEEINENLSWLKSKYEDISGSSLDDVEKGKVLYQCQLFIIDIMKHINKFGIVLIKTVSGVIE